MKFEEGALVRVKDHSFGGLKGGIFRITRTVAGGSDQWDYAYVVRRNPRLRGSSYLGAAYYMRDLISVSPLEALAREAE